MAFPKTVNLLLFLLVVVAHSASAVSEKGRKLREDDGLQDLDGDWFGDGDAGDGDDVDVDFGDDFGDGGGGDDDFGFSFDELEDFGDIDKAEVLPYCEDLSEIELEEGADCNNETKIVEIRYNDLLTERLISQVWDDFQERLQEQARVQDFDIDPLDVDAQMPEPIAIKQTGGGYTADVKMSKIKIYGLSGIRLDEATVTRNENLTDLHVDVRFGFDQLIINGTYDLKGTFGWWDLDSNGTQNFNIAMVNATFSSILKMDIVDASESWQSLRCGPDGNVLITDIGLPLMYDDVNFKFDNLGAFANTVVNGVGIYFLQSQEEMLITEIRKVLKREVNSLIC